MMGLPGSLQRTTGGASCIAPVAQLAAAAESTSGPGTVGDLRG